MVRSGDACPFQTQSGLKSPSRHPAHFGQAADLPPRRVASIVSVMLTLSLMIDNFAKAGVPASVLEDIARSAMDLLSP
jgi:hypothetical protein